MIAKVETVFIKTYKLEEAAQWYKTVFKLPIKWSNERAIAFEAGETDLTIVEETTFTPLPDAAFTLFAQDIDAFYNHLVKQQVETSTVQVWEHIRYLSFQDPAGNHLQVCQY